MVEHHHNNTSTANTTSASGGRGASVPAKCVINMRIT